MVSYSSLEADKHWVPPLRRPEAGPGMVAYPPQKACEPQANCFIRGLQMEYIYIYIIWDPSERASSRLNVRSLDHSSILHNIPDQAKKTKLKDSS